MHPLSVLLEKWDALVNAFKKNSNDDSLKNELLALGEEIDDELYLLSKPKRKRAKKGRSESSR